MAAGAAQWVAREGLSRSDVRTCVFLCVWGGGKGGGQFDAVLPPLGD